MDLPGDRAAGGPRRDDRADRADARDAGPAHLRRWCPRGGAPSGIASYTRIDPATGQVEVAGVLYARSLQRTRAATEAIHLLMRYAFDGPRLPPVRVEVRLAQRAVPTGGRAARLHLRGPVPPPHGDQGPQPRHRLVLRHRRRVARRTRGARAWLDPANFDEAGCQLMSLSRSGTVGMMDQRISFVTARRARPRGQPAVLRRRARVDAGPRGRGRRPHDHGGGARWCSRCGTASTSRPRSARSRSPTASPPFTIAHNVATPEEVDAVLATARAAGADPVHDAVEREWGGYTGYFGDPDGYRWEIATTPDPSDRWCCHDRPQADAPLPRGDGRGAASTTGASSS